MVAKQAKYTQGDVPSAPDAISGFAINNGLEIGLVTIEIEDGIIKHVSTGYHKDAWRIPDQWRITPGLIDLQVNGLNGIHLATQPDQLEVVARMLPAVGVTTFLATLPSPNRKELESLNRSFDGLEVIRETEPLAEPIGIHLEGPALSTARAGAHPTERILPPEEVLEFLDFTRVRLITLAPECHGADKLIREAIRRDITVAAGHTDGTYEDGVTAIESGVHLLTHAFNAMRPLRHREPGLIAAYLESPITTICVIADGIHVSPVILGLLWRLKGPHQIALVSDTISLTPLSLQGHSELVGAEYSASSRTVAKPLIGGLCPLSQGIATLARSEFASVPELLNSATSVPARAIGLAHRGELKPGHFADLTIIDLRGSVVATWCKGKLAWHPSNLQK